MLQIHKYFLIKSSNILIEIYDNPFKYLGIIILSFLWTHHISNIISINKDKNSIHSRHTPSKIYQISPSGNEDEGSLVALAEHLVASGDAMRTRGDALKQIDVEWNHVTAMLDPSQRQSLMVLRVRMLRELGFGQHADRGQSRCRGGATPAGRSRLRTPEAIRGPGGPRAFSGLGDADLLTGPLPSRRLSPRRRAAPVGFPRSGLDRQRRRSSFPGRTAASVALAARPAADPAAGPGLDRSRAGHGAGARRCEYLPRAGPGGAAPGAPRGARPRLAALRRRVVAAPVPPVSRRHRPDPHPHACAGSTLLSGFSSVRTARGRVRDPYHVPGSSIGSGPAPRPSLARGCRRVAGSTRRHGAAPRP